VGKRSAGGTSSQPCDKRHISFPFMRMLRSFAPIRLGNIRTAAARSFAASSISLAVWHCKVFPDDWPRLLARLLKESRNKGAETSTATFSAGGCQDLVNGASHDIFSL